MMGKALGAVIVAAAAAPAGFVALLAGPLAANQSANVAAACQMVLGAAPQPDSTITSLAGEQAAAVAATLTQPVTDPQSGQVIAPAPVDPDQMIGPRAYGFVTTLNTLDNWRALPAAEVARWAWNPTGAPAPAGALTLPAIPIAQTEAVQVDEQADTAWERGCAAVIGRATATTLTPAAGQPAQPGVVRAVLAAAVGQTMSNLALLRVVNPAADKDDPRQFYLDHRPVVSAPQAGDIIVFDFTIAGPAHFGIALDDRQMVTTGSAAGGPVAVWPIPANCSAMSPILDSDTPQEGTAP